MMFVDTYKEPVALAIETSSRIGSVSLGVGDKIISEISFSCFMRHSAEIFPCIRNLLSGSGIKPNQIKHIYISNGPGSFTGLRIASTIAKMLFLANHVQIITVDSLDVTAFNSLDAIKASNQDESFIKAEETMRIASILDAKRGQFFIAGYMVKFEGKKIWLEKFWSDSLMTAADFISQFADKQKPVWLLGDGLLYYKQQFNADGINFLQIRSRLVVRSPSRSRIAGRRALAYRSVNRAGSRRSSSRLTLNIPTSAI